MVLEVRVEGATGLNLNDDCFVAVKVGDELKQARYKPDRSYKFTQTDGVRKPKSGRIDLFKQIGSCKIDACSGIQEIALTSTDKATSGVKLRVAVSADEKGAPSPKGGAQVREDLTKSAKEYLKGHQVEDMLSEAVKAILKERPADPRAFIVKYLSQGSEEAVLPEPPKPPEPPAPVPQVQEAPAKAPAEVAVPAPEPVQKPAAAPPETPAPAPAPKVDPVALDSLRLKVQGGMKSTVASGNMGNALKTAELERSRMKAKSAFLKVAKTGGLCSFLQKTTNR
jgi:hypothetical protein